LKGKLYLGVEGFQIQRVEGNPDKPIFYIIDKCGFGEAFVGETTVYYLQIYPEGQTIAKQGYYRPDQYHMNKHLYSTDSFFMRFY
jgi:hypothetical protein